MIIAIIVWLIPRSLCFCFPQPLRPILFPSEEKELGFWQVWLDQIKSSVQFSSVQFSRSVVSDTLRPHESQHARPPCPSPSPGVHSDSHPSNPWCHPAISSSVVPFSSCPQSLPASESFPVTQLFASGGQGTGVSALASVLVTNIQDWFLLGWLVGSPCSPRDSQKFFQNFWELIYYVSVVNRYELELPFNMQSKIKGHGKCI